MRFTANLGASMTRSPSVAIACAAVRGTSLQPSLTGPRAVDRRYGSRHVWRHSAGRLGGSLEPGADREEQNRRDRQRKYQIIDLRLGIYTVTFTLPGFNTVARQNLELSGGGVTTVNEMRVGGIQGDADRHRRCPVVDIHTSTNREQVLSEFIRQLPASRGYGNYLAGVPGIQGTGLGTSANTSNNFFTARGGRCSEGNIQLDGMNVGSSVGGGGASGYQLRHVECLQRCKSPSPAVWRKSIAAGRRSTSFQRPAATPSAALVLRELAGEWAQGSNIDDELRS